MDHRETNHSHEGDHHGVDGHHEHDIEAVGVGLVTISSSRTLSDDPTGDALVTAVEANGSTVASRDLVSDEVAAIRAVVESMLDDETVDVIVTSGGTGLTRDDVTLQAVDPLFRRQIPGFGELFRYRSYEEIGAMAMASRAAAGLADDVPVFCLPGSESGATLALEELILPTANHLVGLARRHHD